MLHLTFLLYLLSLIAASASITSAVVFFFSYRNKALIYYALMLGVVMLLLLHRMVEAYCNAMELTGTATRFFLAAIEHSAYITGLFAGPMLMHHLLGIRRSAARTRFYLAVALLYSIGAVVEVLLLSHPISPLLRDVFCLPLLFGMYGYCLMSGILSIKKLGSPIVRFIVIALLCISILILPFSLYQYVSGRPYVTGFLERPLLFLLFFAASIVFTIRYFNHPSYVENQQPTRYFKERFALTDREGEIIAEAIKGFPNQQIADRFFISPRTVESHLYSIFQKVGVKNRVQLANLMQTNSR